MFGTAATNPTTGAAATRGDVLTGGLVWRRANTRYGFTESIANQTDLFGSFDTGSVTHSFAIGGEVSWKRRGAARWSWLAPRR